MSAMHLCHSLAHYSRCHSLDHHSRLFLQASFAEVYADLEATKVDASRSLVVHTGLQNRPCTPIQVQGELLTQSLVGLTAVWLGLSAMHPLSGPATVHPASAAGSAA